VKTLRFAAVFLFAVVAAVGCGQPGEEPPADIHAESNSQPTQVHCIPFTEQCEGPLPYNDAQLLGGTWAKEHCVRQGNKFTWSNYDYCKDACLLQPDASGVQRATCVECMPDATRCQSNHVLLRCDDSGHWQEDDYC